MYISKFYSKQIKVNLKFYYDINEYKLIILLSHVWNTTKQASIQYITEM